MSDRTLQAQITAVDKASPVFQQVANGAQRMGNTIDQSAQKAGRSTDDLNKRMAALGAGLTAGAALLGQWSRSAQDAEAIQRQLEASIAATGESFDTYAAQIEEVGARAVQLGQDDEAAMQAISALTQITGSASVAIEEMGLVMDLAAAKSISLESAAELVGKVHEGNTGILQRYGIVVDENATAEEALGQIQAQVAGQAEAHATTYARLREELSNVTDAVGGAVGEFAPLLAMLPGLSTGFTLVGSAVGALGLSLGSAGLVAAAGLAAFAIYKLVDAETASEEGARNAEAAAAKLADTLGRLTAEGDPFAEIAASEKATLDAIMKSLPALIEQLQTARDELLEPFGGKAKGLPPDVQAQFDDLMAVIQALQGLVLDSSSIWADFNEIISDTGTGAELAQKALADAFTTFAQTGDAVRFLGTLQDIADNLGYFDEQANRAARSASALWNAVRGIPAETPGLMDRLTGKVKEATAAVEEFDRTFEPQPLNLKEFNQALQETGGIVFDPQPLQNLKELNQELQATGGIVFEPKELNLTEFNKGLQETETAFQRLARGSTSAGVALRAFKDIQDGIISQQDVFNQQFSEYGSQISAIERAQEILNKRREEGVKLSQDELDFLDEAPKALERLEGGQEDAAIAAGELAAQYGENMTAGDRLNQTLGGLDSTLQGVSDSVSTLVAVLVELNNTDAEPSVALSGAGDALADALTLKAALNSVEGVYNATVNVGANIDPRISGALPFRDGGIVPYEEARIGTVTRGMRAVRVGEAGPETVVLPAGSRVRNAAATAASGHGGVIVNLTIHKVEGMGEWVEAVDTMTRTIRARFAGLGM